MWFELQDNRLHIFMPSWAVQIDILALAYYVWLCTPEFSLRALFIEGTVPVLANFLTTGPG